MRMHTCVFLCVSAHAPVPWCLNMGQRTTSGVGVLRPGLIVTVYAELAAPQAAGESPACPLSPHGAVRPPWLTVLCPVSVSILESQLRPSHCRPSLQPPA